MDLLSDIRREVSGDAADFRMEREIGSGGFGSVYEGKELASNRPVAIKVINQKLTDAHGRDLKSMLNEIQHLKMIPNKKLLEYVSSYISDDQLHIVTEYIDGYDLGNVALCKQLSQTQVAYMCKSTLTALEALHEKNVVHRDLKGPNIMMDKKSGKVKLLDLGLSTKVDVGVRSACGTVLYMAPEVSQRQLYNCKIDIWSLGITAMALFNGQPPSYYSAEDKVLDDLRHNKIPNISFRKAVKSDMQDFVVACLDANPKTRPSAATLLKHPFLKNVATQRQMKQLADDVRKWKEVGTIKEEHGCGCILQ